MEKVRLMSLTPPFLVAPRTAHRDSEPNPAMVREGYGTSGEGNGTTVGHPKMGAGEVLPLLARDPNYSSVPGSDAEPRLSDAGSGNDGPKKAARGRASLHGEVLLANKTLKKKPYKSLGWSLIAVRALATRPWLRLSRRRRHIAKPRTLGLNRPVEVKHPTFSSNAPMPSARAAARTPRVSASPPIRRALERRSHRMPRHPTPLPPRPASCPRLTARPPRSSLGPASARLGSVAKSSARSRRLRFPQAAASGILVACMVAAAVVPFSSVGPAHAVDTDTATTFNEHMGFDDEGAVAAVGEGRLPPAADDAREPMTPEAFAEAVEARGGTVATARSAKKEKAWPAPLVVVPAVFDEWDASKASWKASSKKKESAVPDWATPGPDAPYAVSELYQRRDETSANFVPNHAYETGVFLKFVIDNYENLPEATAFVGGDFARAAGGDAAAAEALERVAEAVSAAAELGKKSARSSSRKHSGGSKTRGEKADAATPAVAPYQPLVADPETFLQSRSPGELVQMWKEQSWGWEDIMGDSAGAAAAHLSRCWRGLAETFGSEEPEHHDKHHDKKAPRLGASFFFASSSASSARVAEEGEAKPPPRAASRVSAADRDELAKPPVTVSLYPGAHFAVTRDALLRLPKKTWERAYEQLVEDGSCFPSAAETGERDEIRDAFDLGVSLEFLSHVIFGGAPLDAGADARCCGASCVLEDPSCAELGDLAKEQSADAYDVASIGGPRFDLDAKRMRSVERVISRYNGWNLKELREERLEADVAAVGDIDDDVDADDDAAPEDLADAEPDAEADPAEIEAELEAEDAALEAEEAELDAGLDEEDEDSDLGEIAYVTADLGASQQYTPEDWGDARKTLRAAETKWQHLIDAEKTKVGTLGETETRDVASPDDGEAAANAAGAADGAADSESELKKLLAEYVEQSDAQLAEISALEEENARLREAEEEARAVTDADDVVDLGADEAARSGAARASSMDKQTLVAMAKRKIDEEETANAKLKEAMAAMEDTHHEERAVYNRRVAAVRAAKRDAEEKRASADEATAALQKELDAEKARAEKARTDAEAALEHDERRVANLHAKLRDAAKLEKEMEEKKNVAADAARRLRQRLAEADRAEAAEAAEAEPAAAKKPIAAVGAAEEGVAALALPPRRRPATATESQ